MIFLRKASAFGLVNQSQFHPREIYRVAIQDSAVSIMFAATGFLSLRDRFPSYLV